MSLNIPQKILDVSSKVTVEIDLEKLGPRQKTSLVNMLRTGHITGNGVPAVIAKYIRASHKSETVHTDRGWYSNPTAHINNGTDGLKQTLRVALVASKLDQESRFYKDQKVTHWYGNNAIENDAEVLSDGCTKTEYDVITLSTNAIKIVTKQKLNTPQAVLDVANNIEAGVTKALSINYN